MGQWWLIRGWPGGTTFVWDTLLVIKSICMYFTWWSVYLTRIQGDVAKWIKFNWFSCTVIYRLIMGVHQDSRLNWRSRGSTGSTWHIRWLQRNPICHVYWIKGRLCRLQWMVLLTGWTNRFSSMWFMSVRLPMLVRMTFIRCGSVRPDARLVRLATTIGTSHISLFWACPASLFIIVI